MSAFDRDPLERIAADMIYLSMEHIGTDYEDILEEARKLTDKELVDFITK